MAIYERASYINFPKYRINIEHDDIITARAECKFY